MSSVTQIIKNTKQPRGGYINPRTMIVTERQDGKVLGVENIHPSTAGTVVDYLTRLASGAEPQDAFAISLLGAARLGEEVAHSALLLVASLEAGVVDDAAIVAGCRLANYDVAFRAGAHLYTEQPAPDEISISNVRIMVARSLSFLSEYGPLTSDGFTFLGGYTDKVTSGDGDFLTKDTLWDFKVSVKGPTKDHTLQLLMYLLMGLRSIHSEFDSVTRLGVFNPRLNTVYEIEVADIPVSVIEVVSREVIGYADPVLV